MNHRELITYSHTKTKYQNVYIYCGCTAQVFRGWNWWFTYNRLKNTQCLIVTKYYQGFGGRVSTGEVVWYWKRISPAIWNITITFLIFGQSLQFSTNMENAQMQCIYNFERNPSIWSLSFFFVYMLMVIYNCPNFFKADGWSFNTTTRSGFSQNVEKVPRLFYDFSMPKSKIQNANFQH